LVSSGRGRVCAVSPALLRGSGCGLEQLFAGVPVLDLGAQAQEDLADLGLADAGLGGDGGDLRAALVLAALVGRLLDEIRILAAHGRLQLVVARQRAAVAWAEHVGVDPPAGLCLVGCARACHPALDLFGDGSIRGWICRMARSNGGD